MMNLHGVTEDNLGRIVTAVYKRSRSRNPDIDAQHLLSMAGEAVAMAMAVFDPARGSMPATAYLNHFADKRMRGKRGLVKQYRRRHGHDALTLQGWQDVGGMEAGKGLAWCELDDFLRLFKGRDRRIIDLLVAGHTFRRTRALLSISQKELDFRLARIRQVCTAWRTGRAAGPMCCGYRASSAPLDEVVAVGAQT